LSDLVEIIVANLQKSMFLAEAQSSPGATFLATIEQLQKNTRLVRQLGTCGIRGRV